MFLVVAMDGIYQGLHGMVSYELVLGNSEKEAYEIGREMSIEIITDYEEIYDNLVEQVEEELEYHAEEEDDAFRDTLIEEAINEDVIVDIYKINEQGLAKTTKELEDILYSDPDGFINQFCEIY